MTKTDNYFESLINNDDNTDYSRYLFFYINYLIENNRLDETAMNKIKIQYTIETIILYQYFNFHIHI